MDYSSTIGDAIVATLALAISGFLTTFLKNSNSETIEGNSVLQMPKLYLYLSPALFTGFILCEYVGLIRTEMNLSWQLRVVYSLFGCFLCFGGINTLLLYKRHKIIYNNERIKQISWLGKEKTIKWDDIAKISFSSISSSLKVKTKNDEIFIHEHIKGYKLFCRQLERKTGLKS